MRKSPVSQVPEVPMEATGEPDVLYGCRFTLSQVEALAGGTVPAEVQRFFQRYLDLFTKPVSGADLLP